MDDFEEASWPWGELDAILATAGVAGASISFDFSIDSHHIPQIIQLGEL